MINKFRIFDKEENAYCEEPDYRWFLSRNGKLYNSENDEWHVVGERYIVEFSTGSFDCNKTEIFEGDMFPDEDSFDGSYYLIEYDLGLSKFCVNLYGYAITYNEGGGEVFDNHISLIDKNIIDISDLYNASISGSINYKHE